MNTSGQKILIMLFEQDYQTGLLLIEYLRSQNYRVIITPDEQTAINWLETTTVSPDLILINQVNSTILEYVEMFECFTKQTSLPPNTPLIIIVEGYDEALEGRQRQIGDNQYIIYMESPDQLNLLIRQVYSDE